MMDTLRVGSWAAIDGGCPMGYKFPIDGGIAFTFGGLVDLLFDDESVRTLARLSGEVVATLDARGGAGQVLVAGSKD